MGIYNKEIENILLTTPVKDNVLFGYDNYTYHIQFFMLPYNIQKEYLEKKTSLEDNDELTKLINNNKIIIAESGYTPDFDIVSFTTHTVPCSASNTLSVTTNYTLKLEEIGGNSLINKMALLSLILGYDSYVKQPYFVSVWFTGYENKNATSGKPIDIIDNKVFTYQCVIEDVKTDTEFTKTSYTLEMVSLAMKSLDKDVAIPTDVSQFEFSSGTSFSSAINEIFKRLNENYRKNHKDDEVISQVYGNKDIYSYNILYNKGKNNGNTFDDPILEKSIVFKPNTLDSNISIIKRLWEAISPNDNRYITIHYDSKLIGSVNNITYYQMIYNIVLYDVPNLKVMKEKIIKNEYFDDVVSNQLEYLNGLTNIGSIVKRYYYLLNGKDTSVLSYSTSEDQMWYLNTSVHDLDDIGINTIQEKEKELTSDTVLNSSIVSINDRITSLRNNSKNLRVYVDDIFTMFSENEINMLKSYRYMAATSSENLTDKQKEITTVVEDKTQVNDDTIMNEGSTLAHIGAENMLSTAQKIEIKLNILGDPYWLEFGSEKKQVSGDMLLPHIIMCNKSFTKTDRMDDYKEDKLMEINTLYRIIEITSTFEGGKFTQQLDGLVATPFVQSTKNSKLTFNNNIRCKSTVPKG